MRSPPNVRRMCSAVLARQAFWIPRGVCLRDEGRPNALYMVPDFEAPKASGPVYLRIIGSLHFFRSRLVRRVHVRDTAPDRAATRTDHDDPADLGSSVQQTSTTGYSQVATCAFGR